MSTKVKRSNYWATIVYPESAPSDWLSRLDSFRIRSFVSPLHDLDTLDTGELKKPHYHVLLLFDSLKSEAQVRDSFSELGGVGCERVNSLRSYARYLCHLDELNKPKYDISCVQTFGGADYDMCINSLVDKYAAAKEIIIFCRDNHIYAYSDIVDYALENRSDWFVALHDSSSLIKEYLRSIHWKAQCKSNGDNNV